MSPERDAAKAEVCFERALAVARAQQAKSWELRGHEHGAAVAISPPNTRHRLLSRQKDSPQHRRGQSRRRHDQRRYAFPFQREIAGL
jgi:hypothetical protein